MTPTEQFSALLHKPWKAVAATGDDTACQIEAYWAEDDSTFTITCPHQLRDLLVELQNVLAQKYAMANEKRKAADDMIGKLDNALRRYC